MSLLKISLINLNVTDGLVFKPQLIQHFGASVASGDFNGDGILDIAVGAPNYFGSSYVYIVIGNQNNFDSFNVTIPSLSTDALGAFISSAKDLNGDKIDDIIIGADGSETIYIIFGQTQFSSTFDLSTLNGSNGFVINRLQSTLSEQKRGISFFASPAGDINNDKLADIILGDVSGKAYVIFGQKQFPSTFNLANLNGTNGFSINSQTVEKNIFKMLVSSLGDINGDKIDDIIVSPINYPEVGRAYVIFGKDAKKDTFPSILNTTQLNDTNGFTIKSGAEEQAIFWSVSSAGDINGDNINDIVISSFFNSGIEKKSYVIFGKNYLANGQFSSVINLANLDGSNGFTITDGLSYSGFWSTLSLGDINGDKVSDLMIVASSPSINGYDSKISVIFGKNYLCDNFGLLLNISNLHASDGFTIEEPLFPCASEISFSVTSSDIDGDNLMDILIGAPCGVGVADQNSEAGALYAVFGKESDVQHKECSIITITAPGTYMGTKFNDKFIVNTTASVEIVTNLGYDVIEIIKMGNIRFSDFECGIDKVFYVGHCDDVCPDGRLIIPYPSTNKNECIVETPSQEHYVNFTKYHTAFFLCNSISSNITDVTLGADFISTLSTMTSYHVEPQYCIDTLVKMLTGEVNYNSDCTTTFANSFLPTVFSSKVASELCIPKPSVVPTFVDQLWNSLNTCIEMPDQFYAILSQWTHAPHCIKQLYDMWQSGTQKCNYEDFLPLEGQNLAKIIAGELCTCTKQM